MQTKIVYQLNESGLLQGEADAWESPLEPGVFLIPRLCVEKAPPKCKAGYAPVYDFDTRKWKKVKDSLVVETPEGFYVQSEEEAARVWRNSELIRADIIINKIEDFEIEGDSRVWRKYRVTLRNWPATEDFPAVKPTAPDA